METDRLTYFQLIAWALEPDRFRFFSKHLHNIYLGYLQGLTNNYAYDIEKSRWVIEPHLDTKVKVIGLEGEELEKLYLQIEAFPQKRQQFLARGKPDTWLLDEAYAGYPKLEEKKILQGLIKTMTLQPKSTLVLTWQQGLQHRFEEKHRSTFPEAHYSPTYKVLSLSKETHRYVDLIDRVMGNVAQLREIYAGSFSLAPLVPIKNGYLKILEELLWFAEPEKRTKKELIRLASIFGQRRLFPDQTYDLDTSNAVASNGANFASINVDLASYYNRLYFAYLRLEVLVE